MRKDLADEQLLLLRLCEIEFTESQVNEIRSLAGRTTNWGRFTDMANKHGISALAYHNIKKLEIDSLIPGDETAILYNYYLKSLSRNTNLWEKYCELRDILSEKKIYPVLIKGMALEKGVYGDTGLRQMNDIDFIVEKDRALEAWDYLLGKGYSHHLIKSGLYRKILPYIGKHMPELYREGVSFEMHVSLFGDTNYHELVLINAKGGIPDPLLHFLFLVKHLHYHEMVKGESQLRLYTDLVMMIKKFSNEILKPGLFENAEELKILDILLEKLFIIKTFWRVELNSTVKSIIKLPEEENIINRFLDFLENPKDNIPGISKRKAYRDNISSIKGFRRKVIFILGDIFPSVEFMKQRYKRKTALAVTPLYLYRMGKLWWLAGL